jgi:hypothetical protein
VKFKVRHVKFTPEEMAIDAANVDASKRPAIARGPEEWQKFLTFKHGFVRLDPELRKAFPDDKAVNEALQKVVELRSIGKTTSRRRSA